MNRLQANLCLICVTLCWASEVVIYACIPEGVSEFATMCVSSLTGTALLLVAFWRRVVDTFRKGGWRFLASMLLLAVLSVVYNQHCSVNVKFSAADGIKMNGGRFTLTSGLDFSGKTLNLVDRPKWVMSAEIDGSGNIVLAVKPRGTYIIVK